MTNCNRAGLAPAAGILAAALLLFSAAGCRQQQAPPQRGPAEVATVTVRAERAALTVPFVPGADGLRARFPIVLAL